MRGRVVLRVVAASGALLAAAGCGIGGGGAEPQGPATTSAVSSVPTVPPLAGASEPFEPCQAVPGEVLEANGFDPGSAARTVLGLRGTWRECQWRSLPGVTWHRERYSVAMSLHAVELGQLRGRADLADRREVAVNGRSGLEFGFPGDEDTSCYAAFETRAGGIAVVSIDMGIAAQVRPRVPGEPECTELLGRHAGWLEPYLPR